MDTIITSLSQAMLRFIVNALLMSLAFVHLLIIDKRHREFGRSSALTVPLLTYAAFLFAGTLSRSGGIQEIFIMTAAMLCSGIVLVKSFLQVQSNQLNLLLAVLFMGSVLMFTNHYPDASFFQLDDSLNLLLVPLFATAVLHARQRSLYRPHGSFFSLISACVVFATVFPFLTLLRHEARNKDASLPNASLLERIQRSLKDISHPEHKKSYVYPISAAAAYILLAAHIPFTFGIAPALGSGAAMCVWEILSFNRSQVLSWGWIAASTSPNVNFKTDGYKAGRNTCFLYDPKSNQIRVVRTKNEFSSWHKLVDAQDPITFLKHKMTMLDKLGKDENSSVAFVHMHMNNGLHCKWCTVLEKENDIFQQVQTFTVETPTQDSTCYDGNREEEEEATAAEIKELIAKKRDESKKLMSTLANSNMKDLGISGEVTNLGDLFE